MKKSIKLFALIFALTITSLSVQAKHRVGLIVILDTTITHTHIGWTAFENFSNTYPMPFQLSGYCKEAAIDVLAGGYSTIEVVLLADIIYKEYAENYNKLKGKEFKSFRKEWFARIKLENDIDALIVISNMHSFHDLHPSIAVEGLGLFNGMHSKHNTAYIKLTATIFWKPKPKYAYGLSTSDNSKELPRYQNRKIKIRKSDLLLLESPLQELIKLQLTEITQDANYREMKLYLNENY